MSLPALVPPRAARARHLTPRASRSPVLAAADGGTVLLFGVGGDARIACEDAAREAGLTVLELRHLQAACRALTLTPCSLLVVGPALKPWDRDVAADAAGRAGIPVFWLEPGGVEAAERAVRAAGARRTAHHRPR